MVRRPHLLLAATVAVMLLSPGAAGGAPIATGAFVPDSYRDPGLINSYGRLVGRKPVIVLSYKTWSIPPFDRSELGEIWDRGAVPMVTWEPWTDAGRGIPLRAISAGRYDPYLRRSARYAAAWGQAIFLRFGHEMNGDWYPWGNGVRGNTPGDYRRAWRHVVSVFRGQSAENVKWVFSPNEDSGGRFPFSHLYPGDAWVDWVALDGFNWGAAKGWPSFTRIFASTYDRLVALSARPMMIAETGSAEEGGDKAAWITSALVREAPRFSHIRALVWFDDTEPEDFRPNSSPSALRAFRRALSSPVYRATRGDLLSTPAELSPHSLAPPLPEGGYGAPSFLARIGRKLHGEYPLLVVAGVALLVAAAVAVVVLRRSKRARGA